MSITPQKAITRLTALWALSESGLGGFMYAFKIPFTGLVLGGFAVAMIILIAFHSNSPAKDIIKATFLVMLIKAIASPHSAIFGYIAIAFQGLSGALFFSTIPFFRLSALMFGFVALAESAIQKLLVMTLIFGNSFWEAIDIFLKGIVKEIGLAPHHQYSYWIIVAYTLFHGLWGLLVANWSVNVAQKLEQYAATLLPKLLASSRVEQSPKTRKKSKWVRFVFIVLFIATVFLIEGFTMRALYAVLRSIAAVLLLWYVVGPLTKWLADWVRQKHQGSVAQYLSALPRLRAQVLPAMSLAKQEKKGLTAYPRFAIYLIIYALYHENE